MKNKNSMMKKWGIKNKLYLAGAVAGAIAGYMYWNYIGCSSGTCIITSKPLNSTIYGALIGSLLLGMFKKYPKKKNQD